MEIYAERVMKAEKLGEEAGDAETAKIICEAAIKATDLFNGKPTIDYPFYYVGMKVAMRLLEARLGEDMKKHCDQVADNMELTYSITRTTCTSEDD